jgi:Divergent InlB B-repeat domain
MNGKWLSMVVLVAAAGLLLGLNSCAHGQQLVSIQVQPVVENVGATNIPVEFDAGFQVQLRALGTYIHPPVTKDITNEVTWVSNTVQMFTVNSTGLLNTTGDACGGTLVSATANTNTSDGGLSSSGAVVTGYMTANVICYTGSGGGSGNPLLSITFLGSGVGTVADSALNFSCSSPGPCSTQAFTSGTSITLTATPSGSSTFGGWQSCPTSSTNNVCAFSLSGNPVVTATFN